MDTIRRRTRRNELIISREIEDMELWNLEESILLTDEKRWDKIESALESAQLSVRHKKKLLRIEKKVSRQKEKFWRKREELLKRKEDRLEKRLLKLGENCLMETSLGSEGETAQQLLPGIPNEITLDKITTKLSWREVHLFKSVSRGWYSAIRNSLVYDARVHSHLTETFVLTHYLRGSPVLHSLSDNSRFELPRIPYLNTSGYIHDLVAVDGKVYLLGGLFSGPNPGPSDKVYMLDLSRQRSWIRCASMHTARTDFACGVMNGKIYVFGGNQYLERHLCESEVYDPKENKWSLIAPISTGDGGKVATVGKELFVYGRLGQGHDLEIYHPGKDEWRQVTNFDPPIYGTIFEFEGKLHSLDGLGISVHNFDRNEWTKVCSHSFSEIQSVNPLDYFNPYHVIAFEGKLFASGSIFNSRGCEEPHVFGSIGVAAQNGELAWREERGWALDESVWSMWVVHL